MSLLLCPPAVKERLVDVSHQHQPHQKSFWQVTKITPPAGVPQLSSCKPMYSLMVQQL